MERGAMKKSWVWLLVVPFMAEAANLKFLSDECEHSGDSLEIAALFEEELSKIDEELLLQVEKMPLQKPVFPWIDDEVADVEISLFVENEAKEAYKQAERNHRTLSSMQQESERDFHPTFEEVPSRANRFWSSRAPLLDSKPAKVVQQKPYIQDLNPTASPKQQPSVKKGIQTKGKTSKKPHLKKQTSSQRQQVAPRKKGIQVEVAKKRASPVVKNFEKQSLKTTEAPRKRLLKKVAKEPKNLQNQQIVQQTAAEEKEQVIKKESHLLPDYFPDWDTE